MIVPCNNSFQALADMDNNEQQGENCQGDEQVADGEFIKGSNDDPKTTKICLMYGCNEAVPKPWNKLCRKCWLTEMTESSC